MRTSSSLSLASVAATVCVPGQKANFLVRDMSANKEYLVASDVALCSEATP